ncbi:ABC transporter ATP-binding protein [Elioraea sp.]|uniref:ABC transporter ATP-binding protein n=1 Tax=Elioraea sp. TaxID=2185103 RepID=UPI00307F5648
MSGLLSIRELSVRLPRGADRSHALVDVSLDLAPNEILCLVGESGSGKSLTAAAVMGLLPGPQVFAEKGAILFEGRDLLRLSEAEMRAIRGARIGMIFQEPMTALNPVIPVGRQIEEVLEEHTAMTRAERVRRVLALLEEVRIPDPASAARAHPHELSGGQRQRAMIAMALALNPRLLIADEPTTALDVTTQKHILGLIRELQRSHGTGVLFITHDFGVVAEIADRVAVMQHGRVVEQGAAEQVLNRPSHPYTRALIAAVPTLAHSPRGRDFPCAPVLAVRNLSKTYRPAGLFARRRTVHAVKDVSFDLHRGETLGIVGESGSGKSTVARCLVRLLDPDGGSMVVDGLDMAALSRARLRREARRVQMVFQDPFASLNPRRTAGDLVAQGPMLHGVPREEAQARAAELFRLVCALPAAMSRLPHEFSGGQRQRIGLARALAMRPTVLVADEPVSALDVSVQAQVLRLLRDLRDRLRLSIVFITHDLRVAAELCDRIAVMHEGEIVEHGPTAEVFAAPRHDYTRTLMDSIPGRTWTPPALEPA